MYEVLRVGSKIGTRRIFQYTILMNVKTFTAKLKKKKQILLNYFYTNAIILN